MEEPSWRKVEPFSCGGERVTMGGAGDSWVAQNVVGLGDTWVGDSRVGLDTVGDSWVVLDMVVLGTVKWV